MANENRSGDYEGGMSKVLQKVADAAYKVFSADDRFKRIKEINVELLDRERLANYTYVLKFQGNKLSISGSGWHSSSRQAQM